MGGGPLLKREFGFRFCSQGRRSLHLRCRLCLCQSLPCGFKVLFINLESDTGGDTKVAGGQGRGSDSDKGIEEDGFLSLAMQFDALFHEGRGKGGRVWALIFS